MPKIFIYSDQNDTQLAAIIQVYLNKFDEIFIKIRSAGHIRQDSI